MSALSLVEIMANGTPSRKNWPMREQQELCIQVAVNGSFSHDLSPGLSTHDSFHQLLKEVNPLAIAPDFDVVFGLDS